MSFFDDIGKTAEELIDILPIDEIPIDWTVDPGLYEQPPGYYPDTLSDPESTETSWA
jgi:hypothetical protein